MCHYCGMKNINLIPQSELVYNLRRLSEAAKIVAYAKSEEDAEYFTMNYLRPLIKETETLLNNDKVQKHSAARYFSEFLLLLEKTEKLDTEFLAPPLTLIQCYRAP